MADGRVSRLNAFCVMDAAGKILARAKVASDPGALFAALKGHYPGPERIVLENRSGDGDAVVLAGAGAGPAGPAGDGARRAARAHAVMKPRHNKRDAGDAELLAEIARRGFYRAPSVKSEAAREARILLKERAVIWCASGAIRRTRSGAFWGPWGFPFPRARAS